MTLSLRMSSLSHVIGKEFERVFYDSFPGFINTTADKNVPDFYHPILDFWVETKTGNSRWGPRIHRYQIDRFKRMDKPVVYALGFHNFDNAILRLSGRSEKQQRKILQKDMTLKTIVFVNSDLIASIWNKDSRVSKKEGTKYLTLKLSTVRNLLEDRPFRRFKKRISSPSVYYGFESQDFCMLGPSINSKIPPIRTILHCQEDLRILEYLRQERFISNP